MYNYLMYIHMQNNLNYILNKVITQHHNIPIGIYNYFLFFLFMGMMNINKID